MKSVIEFALRGYKRWISPMLPNACRFVPTCSEYAIEAVERYGALRGSWMAMARLLRCHPLAPGGFDPVPLEGSRHICNFAVISHPLAGAALAGSGNVCGNSKSRPLADDTKK
jgi:putative membrane protein insertion efficiency factor